MRINIILRSLVLAGALLCIPAGSRAVPRVGFVVSVRIAPPILPVYVQPICPGPGYIWEPGYWAYGDEGFYWVPGTWVFPPSAGLLWTPGYFLTAFTYGTSATGGRPLVSTVESTTGSATLAEDSMAATGEAANTSTTLKLRT
jgi:WXXGXW repeat (2 copies)